MKPELFLGGLLGLIPVAIGILEKKSSYQKKLNALNLFQKKTDFLTNWFKAQESVCNQDLDPLRTEITQELNKVGKEFKNLFEDNEETIVVPAKRNFFQKIFLAYIPQSIFAKVWQALYYMSWGFLGLMILGSAIDENSGDFSISAFKLMLDDPDIGAVFIFLVLLLLLFQYLSRVSEKIFFLNRINNLKK
jgi:hypothetical protein